MSEIRDLHEPLRDAEVTRGPLDGKTEEISPPSQYLKTFGKAPGNTGGFRLKETTYRMNIFRCGKNETRMYVHDSIPVEEILERLIAGYKPS